MGVWNDLARVATVIMPFTTDRRLMSKLQGRRLLVTADGPLMRLPFDALVLRTANRKAPGSPPVFVGSELNIQLVLPEHAQAEFKQDGKSAVIGPIASAEAACMARGEGIDACKAKRGQSLVAALTPALTHRQLGVRLDGEKVSKQAFLGALRGKLGGLILSPADFPSATFLVGGEDGSVEFNELSTLGTAKELFMLTTLFDPTPLSRMSMRQLLSAAKAGEADAIAINLRTPPMTVMYWPARAMPALSGMRDAIFGWKRFAMASPLCRQVGDPTTTLIAGALASFCGGEQKSELIKPISADSTQDSPYAEEAERTRVVM